jgi:hypothetical protein
VSIDNHTPPAADYTCNINNSNLMNCYHLVAPAAVAATISVASSMRKRVMKRAGDIFFSEAVLPATKKAAGKVCAFVSWEDAAYTWLWMITKQS